MRLLKRAFNFLCVPLYLISLPVAALDVAGYVADGPAVVPVRAAYLTLNNPSQDNISITAVSSPQFANAEIHQSIERDGRVSMTELEVVNIGPGATVVMKPGGVHVMLFDPVEALKRGDCVELVLVGADGATFNARVQIEAAGDDAGAHAHHH